MKKTSDDQLESIEPDEMLSEYDFDYAQAKPNRYTAKASRDQVVVILDPDVSQVFRTPESVNTALRALIAAIPDLSKDQPNRN